MLPSKLTRRHTQKNVLFQKDCNIYIYSLNGSEEMKIEILLLLRMDATQEIVMTSYMEYHDQIKS